MYLLDEWIIELDFVVEIGTMIKKDRIQDEELEGAAESTSLSSIVLYSRVTSDGQHTQHTK